MGWGEGKEADVGQEELGEAAGGPGRQRGWIRRGQPILEVLEMRQAGTEGGKIGREGSETQGMMDGRREGFLNLETSGHFQN